jgi:hypothetical protein
VDNKIKSKTPMPVLSFMIIRFRGYGNRYW